MPKKENKPLIYLAFAAIYIIWGSTYYFIFLGLETIPPFMLMGFRFVVSGLVLLGPLKKQGNLIWPQRNDILKNSIYGTLLLVGGTGSIMWAEQFVASGIVSIVFCILPFWFLILDFPKWKENFSNVTTLMGLIIGFSGVFILFEGNNSIVSEHFVLGIATVTIGGILWTLGSLFSRYYPTTLSTLMNVSLQFISAGIICLGISYFMGEMKDFQVGNVSLLSWLSTAYLAIFGILAFGAYMWLITKRPLIQVGTYVYVNPVIAILLGWMFANETINTKQLLALFIILFGVVLINWTGYKTKILNRKPVN
ncbi:EamA family transporter [uncultured Flavobacterium sp.]|uniref:EamA family transporter n=1 Tax=uncultured Flavobacterium sp. TaxID=165435 RepID=UPI0030CA1841